MLCAVNYIFNLLCGLNCLQPMKKFVFSVASRATGRLQIKPSGSGDENGHELLVVFGFSTPNSNRTDHKLRKKLANQKQRHMSL